jgi:DNA-directed RNA polymerase subunit F|tara:strand:+ start:1277 stop:1621 length:345 start_codon:yes stop_codon:yes gene_type:complete
MASEIISETPISTYQLKEELEKIKKRDKELNFRAAKTEEHLEHLELSKNADSLFDKISKLNISRLKEQHITKIVDIMPSTIKDLKVVMQGYTISINNESLKKIVDAVNGFIGKK